jgi:hypothetical protein
MGWAEYLGQAKGQAHRNIVRDHFYNEIAMSDTETETGPRTGRRISEEPLRERGLLNVAQGGVF